MCRLLLPSYGLVAHQANTILSFAVGDLVVVLCRRCCLINRPPLLSCAQYGRYARLRMTWQFPAIERPQLPAYSHLTPQEDLCFIQNPHLHSIAWVFLCPLPHRPRSGDTSLLVASHPISEASRSPFRPKHTRYRYTNNSRALHQALFLIPKTY